MARIGVTIVTGAPGAGKTSVVRSLAEQFGPARVAVVSNELTRLDHDARLLTALGLRVVSVPGECGTQRPLAIAHALDTATDLLTETGPAGRIIVELAGFAATGPLLGALEAIESDRWSIDGVVSVFDARTLLDDRLEVDTTALDASQLSPGALIEEQIATATSIVLNFASQAQPDDITHAGELIERLNPDATIETTDHGRINAGVVIDPVWSGRQFIGHRCAVVGMRAMVFEARRPLHPGRLLKAIEGGSLLGTRSKGIAWLATRHARAVTWDHRGLELCLTDGPAWWASTPPAQWPADRQQWASIFNEWEAPWGDRRQMLSIVGVGLDRGMTAKALEACLLTDSELALGRLAWAQWDDPFVARSTLRLVA